MVTESQLRAMAKGEFEQLKSDDPTFAETWGDDYEEWYQEVFTSDPLWIENAKEQLGE